MATTKSRKPAKSHKPAATRAQSTRAPQVLHDLHLEKLVFGGQALAHAPAATTGTQKSTSDTPGRTIFVWGGLPDEHVDATVIRRRGGVSEAVVTRVAAPSKDRIPAREEHHLSCSAWQILSPAAEHDWKIKTSQEAFARIGHLELPNLALTGPRELAEHYGYRNKMEFSFTRPTTTSRTLSLAFFERATHQRHAIDGCVLARPEITAAATKLTAWLESQGVTAPQLKSLVVRSDGTRVVAGLFVMDKQLAQAQSKPDVEAARTYAGLSGLAMYYSDPRSPVARIDDVIVTSGSLELAHRVRGRELRYGLGSFFQVNVPVFEQAVERMAGFVQPDEPLIDLYSGVGSIGICLADTEQQLTLVESNEEAIEYAQKNASAAGLTRGTLFASTTERAVHLVTPEATVILDPPRAGLHPHVTQRLAAVRPHKIIYLSCNVSTQARDLALLKEHYRIVDAQLFNFFPRTPHVESLVMLERT